MPYFVGYVSLESWLKAVDPDYQVYAALVVETKERPHLTQLRRQVIVCSQPINDELHYCRIPVALTEWIGGECVSASQEIREAFAANAWATLKTWLAEKNLQWYEAVVAVPSELRDGLMDGDRPEFMRPKTKALAAE